MGFFPFFAPPVPFGFFGGFGAGAAPSAGGSAPPEPSATPFPLGFPNRPRRFISRDELLAQLRELGEELGRTPTVRDIEARRGRMASKSLIWHTFGSLAAALKEAGFDVPIGEERLERAIADGAVLARRLGHLPKMAEWKDARSRDASLLSEWQVYRMVDVHPGAWSAFQYLVRGRLREEGVRVAPDGTLAL